MTRYRRQPCECGGYMAPDDDWGDTGHLDVPIWKCTNCWRKAPRQVRHRRATCMTPTQHKRVKQLRELILEHDGSSTHPEDYEYSRFSVTFQPETGNVFLSTTVERKGSVLVRLMFCRHRHIKIGRSGGLELLNAKYKTRSRGRLWVVHGATT